MLLNVSALYLKSVVLVRQKSTIISFAALFSAHHAPTGFMMKRRDECGSSSCRSWSTMAATTSTSHDAATTVSRPSRHILRHKSDADYICGALASLINISLTFPINKLMFRQQFQGIRVFRALNQLRGEGMTFIFRGFFPPLLQRTTTVSLMFGTYASYREILQKHVPNLNPLGTHMIAAFSAGTTEAILAPFERVQVVLQIREFHGELQNSLHAFRVIAGLGVRELYRGITAILCRNGPSNVLFLGLREPLKNSLPRPKTEIGETINAFLSGAGLGAALSTLFFPLNVVKTRMQARVGGPHLNILAAFHVVFEERGRRWKKLFRGVHINYTRSFLSWGIINASYEVLKRHISF